MFDERTVCNGIGTTTGEAFVLADSRCVGGGSINETWHLRGKCGREYFLKLNKPNQLEMFIAEAEGLQELASAKAIRVPEPICYGGENASHCYLVIDYIGFSSGSAAAEQRLGEQLATLHRVTSGQKGYGWHRDNTIGATPQPNGWKHDWLTFLGEQRLGFQTRLASRNGASNAMLKKCRRVIDGLEYFFEQYRPQASLLHGDLWSGNVGFDENDQPVIFDPAVYFGDRESDLAMTELFGGFSQNFYAAYQNSWPLDPGYARRRELYKLYHILNHFNLFGGSYAAQSETILDKIINSLP